MDKVSMHFGVSFIGEPPLKAHAKMAYTKNTHAI